MYKVPAILILAAIVVSTFLGCSVFCPKPGLELLATQLEATDRVIEKVALNKEELSKVESELKGTKAEEFFKVYSDNRDKNVKSLFEYFKLQLDEYEQLYKLSYGELPQKIQEKFADVRARLELVRSK